MNDIHTPSRAQPTVAILYGLAEGPVIGKKMRRALEEEGFRYITDETQADIIIAHSAGAWFIPKVRNAETILIIAPPTRYQGTELSSQTQKVRMDYRGAVYDRAITAWLIKSFCNAGYLFFQPRRLVQMWSAAKYHRHTLPVIKGARVIIITYRDDPWSEHIGSDGLHLDVPYTFINFDRLHDDLWIHPKDYISVIQYLHAA